MVARAEDDQTRQLLAGATREHSQQLLAAAQREAAQLAISAQLTAEKAGLVAEVKRLQVMLEEQKKDALVQQARELAPGQSMVVTGARGAPIKLMRLTNVKVPSNEASRCAFPL